MEKNGYQDMKIEAAAPGETSSQYAYRVLRENILLMKLTPGQIIQDSALAEVLHLSRTPVREALFRLRDEQLIDIHAKNKTTVSYIDNRLLNESIFIRTSLEISVAKALCGRLPDAFRPQFEENLKIHQLLSSDATLIHRCFEYDNAFHRLLFEAAEKPWAYRTLERSCTQLNRVRYINHTLLNSDEEELTMMKAILADHIRLYRCITENTPALVEEILTAHIGRARIMDKWTAPDSKFRQYIVNLEE